jgi:hypothetical protein
MSFCEGLTNERDESPTFNFCDNVDLRDNQNDLSSSFGVTEVQPFKFRTEARSMSRLSCITAIDVETSFTARPVPDFSRTFSPIACDKRPTTPVNPKLNSSRRANQRSLFDEQ